MSENKQISMAASAIAMRGVRLFLSASKAAAERKAEAPPAPKPRPKPKVVMPTNKLSQKQLDALLKITKFNNFSSVESHPNMHTMITMPPKEQPSRHQHNSERVTFSPGGRAGATGSDMPNKKLKEKALEALFKSTHFSKNELEALYTMYRKLVTAAQAAAPTSAIGQPPAKIDGIDQNTFRDVMHNTFDLVTEEAILERVWVTWERGPAGGEGALKFEAWVKGLSSLLRGTDEERRKHCFAVYDLNSDGYITRDEMFLLLKNSLLKQPGDEDPDEGVRDLVELVLRKLDLDKDGRVSPEDYSEAVEQEPLLLEAFGQCMPSKRHAAAFLKTLSTK